MNFRNRVYLVIAGLILIWALFPFKARAEGGGSSHTKFFATYKVIDGIKKEKRSEEWEVVLVHEGEVIYLVTSKKNPENGHIISFDIEDSEQKRSQTLGQSFYLKQTFEEHPVRINDKGSVFGRIEVMESKEGTIVSAWPITGTVTSHGKIFTLTTQTIIPFTGVIVTTRTYGKENYYLPLYERQQFFGTDGALKEDLLFAKQ